MHYPSDPQCAIFGMCCEAIPRQLGGWDQYQVACMHVSYYLLQVNYLIVEAVNTGKGANNIISMLHHFL